MLDAEFIQDDEYEEAIKEPLGVVSASRNLADIDYAVDLVLSQLPSDVRSRMENEALTVYMTLNPYLQSEASGAMNANIQRLIKASKDIAKREKKNIHLQGALIAIDVKTCGILAVQGGRSYRQTQFNRITQGRRQPGSLFKPFVALAALANPAIQVIPTTEFEDSAFEWKYDKQVWTPRNYDKEYRGKVTMRRLLEQSINIPTARLAEMTGIESIYNTLQAAGIKSRLPAVPSLSLGSADVNPLEVAESYVTLANLGKACALRSYSEVWDENKNLINQNPIQIREALPAAPTFMTVNMMKGTLTHGTARSIMYTNLPYSIFSGKTGTTNDYKDAWFVGFSPGFLVLTWVGYDEEEKVGLTGSAAAVPLWVDFVQRSRPFVGLDDFVPPDGVKLIKIDRNGDPNCSDVIDEYFPSGKEPSQSCG
jgi:penicillin-binding protein 1B